jgi:DNA-binding NtrC family response regulator
MATILVVDDDRNICRVLEEILGRAGFGVLTALDVEAALSLMEGRDPDLLITDLKMPGRSGMELLEESRRLAPATPVIMVTAFADVEAAVAAMKKGAYDFIVKPFDEAELLNSVEKAVSESRRNRELVSSYFDDERRFMPEVVGDAPAIRKLLENVRKVAPTDSTVIVTGETGVGKELIARAVHLASRRREAPFVKVNCAAIPEGLLESELFGHERGAFTGAITAKPGRFELAHRGTVFLDEVGEVPFHLQSKLLGVLQDMVFERVGGIRTIKADVRVVAATNRDLDTAVREGAFRADLYYRLNVVPLHVPPLRDRREDIAPLAGYFLKKYSSKHGRGPAMLSTEALSALYRHDWPGNIRELENVMERVVLMTEAGTIGIQHLPEVFRAAGVEAGPFTLKERVGSVSRLTEKQMIMEALEKTGDNRTRAAGLLGISRRALQKKIKEYGL